MASLTHDDLRRFSEAALTLQGTRSPDDFTTNLLAAMRKVLDMDICTVNWLGFMGRPVITVYDSPEAVPEKVNAALHEFGHQSPVYGKCLDGVLANSDLMSRAAWLRTDLYAQGFKQLGQDDCLMLDMKMAPDCRLSLFASRGRRGYTDEEKQLLALLGPHARMVFDRLALQRNVAAEVASADAAGPLGRLSAREREVIGWLAQGKSNAEIAILLGISVPTVKKHLERIYDKLGVGSRHAAALFALRESQGLE